MEKLIYEGKDITEDVHIIKAVHEMNAGGRYADTIELTMEDAEKKWSKWSPQAGDVIEYAYESGKTGAMFITHPEVVNGVCTLYATALPRKAKEAHTKAWEHTSLQKIGSEVAGRFGYKFVLEKMSDETYDYICQKNQPDISFLFKIAEQEGCGLVIYNRTVTMFNEAQMEAQAPVMQIAAESATFRAADKSGLMYGSCEVKAGELAGIFMKNPKKPRYKPKGIRASTNAEATRFAKGILRTINKDMVTATMETLLAANIAAGITIHVDNDAEPGWTGDYFVYKVRHSYHGDSTKIFLRKPLGGY